MIGHQSITAFIYTVGLLPLFFIMMWPVPDIVKMMVICSIIFTMAALGWILYLISANSIQPAINKVDPEKQEIWVEFNEKGLFTLKIAEKDAHGRSKGVQAKQKADIIDKGNFTVKFRNGNTGIIVFNKMSKAVDPEEAVAWTKIFKKLGVRSGRDAYEKAKKEKQVGS